MRECWPPRISPGRQVVVGPIRIFFQGSLDEIALVVENKDDDIGGEPAHAELPRALGCADWFTARVTTLGELDAAMKIARDSKSGAYIEVIGGRLDMPPVLAFAHGRVGKMYGDAP